MADSGKKFQVAGIAAGPAPLGPSLPSVERPASRSEDFAELREAPAAKNGVIVRPVGSVRSGRSFREGNLTLNGPRRGRVTASMRDPSLQKNWCLSHTNFRTVIQGGVFGPGRFMRLCPEESLWVNGSSGSPEVFRLERKERGMAPHLWRSSMWDKDAKGSDPRAATPPGTRSSSALRRGDAQFLAGQIRNVGSPTIAKAGGLT